MIKIRITVIAILLLFFTNSYSAEPVKLDAIPNKLSNSMSSHFIQANGIRIHYVEAGKGPLIILLHGWPETSYSWRFVMQALSGQYRVIAPDLRGIGLSERTLNGYDKKTIATDIKDLIAALGETQAMVIGHDMGGKAAYIMAHLYPSYVSKLVLVDCLIPGTENTDALHGGAWHYGFHMTPEFPEMLTKGREKEYIQAQINAWSFKKNAISEEAINEYASHYATQGGMTAGFNYYRALPQDAALAKSFQGRKLIMPVLAISGAHGVGDKLSKALENDTTSLQTVIIKDSGHFVAEENPKAFDAIVMKFLAPK